MNIWWVVFGEERIHIGIWLQDVIKRCYDRRERFLGNMKETGHGYMAMIFTSSGYSWWISGALNEGVDMVSER